MIHIPRKTVSPSTQKNTQKDKIGEQESETYVPYKVESTTNFLEEELVPIVQRGGCPVREPIHSQEKQGEERFARTPTRGEEKKDSTN